MRIRFLLELRAHATKSERYRERLAPIYKTRLEEADAAELSHQSLRCL